MKTKTVTVKTPGQRLCEYCGDVAWISLSESERLSFEDDANKLDIQPITEEVPDKPTDGELWVSADNDYALPENKAAKFLKLRAERDGEPVKDEPLEVTEDWLRKTWWSPIDATLGDLAKAINAHRGVRELPKVTAEVWRAADELWFAQVGKSFQERDIIAADYLNAELAKAAERKDGV